MTLFDLLFIVLFLTAIGVLAAAMVAALRGRRDRALRRLRRLGIGAGSYMVVVTLVSLLSPRRVAARGEDQCSDDWCIAVTDIARAGTGALDTFHVAFRLSSRARRVTQRERFVVAYMRDRTGRRYDASPQDGQAPFDTPLGAGESITTSRTFGPSIMSDQTQQWISPSVEPWFTHCHCIVPSRNGPCEPHGRSYQKRPR